MVDISSIKGVKYCHYTTMDNARNILDGEKIYLGRMDAMNDQTESGRHSNDEGTVYSTCFCHSEGKSIPMFYLYSGIDGKGCRLEFSPAKLREIINNLEVYPVNKQGRCLKKRIDPKEYEVYANWIHYVADNGYHIYRGEEDYECSSFTEYWEKYKNIPENYFFIKNPVWRYENEFRIVVRFKNKTEYDRIAIRIPIKKKERGIHVTCGPEMNAADVKQIKEEFLGYGIQTVNSYSEERIQISMNLVERNKGLFKGR